MTKELTVENCSECPFFKPDYENSPEEECVLGNIVERYGFILEDDGFPINCPLRKTSIFINKVM